ncbi:MAG: YtxH domain-containing protein [Muribaculaceae bacterium]|nr:YtxH domain-containing protein [Muribaculaceae bacterium]
MKTLPAILAIAGGVAAGAAVGLLLAPTSGKETRKSIRDFVKSKCPAMKEHKLEALVEKIKEELEEV